MSDDTRTFHEIAVELNNLGVELLADANFAEAAVYFREAIKCELVRDTDTPPCSRPPPPAGTFNEDRNNLTSKSRSSSSTALPSPSSTAAPPLLGSTSSSSIASTPHALLQDDSGGGVPLSVTNLLNRSRPAFLLHSTRTAPPPRYHSATAHVIYNQGITMPLPVSRRTPLRNEEENSDAAAAPSCSTRTTNQQAIQTSIIIFNLALAYHLHGFSEMTNAASNLRQAKVLYEKAARLLFSSLDDGTAGVQQHSSSSITAGTTTATTDLLSMALLNNSAQISFELSAYQDVQFLVGCLFRFTARMRAAAATASSSYDNEDNTTTTTTDTNKLLRAIFILNASIDLRCPTVAAAA